MHTIGEYLGSSAGYEDMVIFFGVLEAYQGGFNVFGWADAQSVGFAVEA